VFDELGPDVLCLSCSSGCSTRPQRLWLRQMGCAAQSSAFQDRTTALCSLQTAWKGGQWIVLLPASP